jgi:hypothetical protein
MRCLLKGVRAAATAAAFFEEAGTAVLTVAHGVARSFIRTGKASLRRSCVPIRRVTGSASASLPRRPTPLEIVCATAPLLTQSPHRRSSAPPAESSRQWGSSRTAYVFRISGANHDVSPRTLPWSPRRGSVNPSPRSLSPNHSETETASMSASGMNSTMKRKQSPHRGQAQNSSAYVSTP